MDHYYDPAQRTPQSVTDPTLEAAGDSIVGLHQRNFATSRMENAIAQQRAAAQRHLAPVQAPVPVPARGPSSEVAAQRTKDVVNLGYYTGVLRLYNEMLGLPNLPKVVIAALNEFKTEDTRSKDRLERIYSGTLTEEETNIVSEKTDEYYRLAKAPLERAIQKKIEKNAKRVLPVVGWGKSATPNTLSAAIPAPPFKGGRRIRAKSRTKRHSHKTKKSRRHH